MENCVTAERLRHLLSYAPDTGVFRWERSTNARAKLGSIAGCPNSAGYLRVSIDGRSYLLHRLAWLYVHGVWPVDQIDHIDGDPLNNRMSNLRESDQAQNIGNSAINRRNTSGFKGVSWSKSNKKWIATIAYDGKQKYLGQFESKEHAATAYASAARAKWGEFARV